MASFEMNVMSSVTFKTFNGTDIRRFTLPTSALKAYSEIVRKICDVYGLEVPRFLAECGLEFFTDGWDSPRFVRSDADLRAVKELAPGSVRPNQLFRVRILVSFDHDKVLLPQQQQQQQQQQEEAAVVAAPLESSAVSASASTGDSKRPAPLVARINKEAVAAIREAHHSGKADAKEDLKLKRQEVRELRMKLKEACKSARISRAEGEIECAKGEKMRAKDIVIEARERLAEAELRLADCKGRVRRVKEEMRAEILAARTEMAAKGAASSSSSSSEDAAVTSAACNTTSESSESSESEAEAEAPATGARASPLDVLQTGACVVIQSLATKRTLKVCAKDNSVSPSGHRGRPARFLVTRCDDLVQFQSLLTGTYLRIDKDEGANARGNGGFCTWFRPVLSAADGSFALQSVFFEKTSGAKVFLCVSEAEAGKGTLSTTESDPSSAAEARFLATSMRRGNRWATADKDAAAAAKCPSEKEQGWEQEQESGRAGGFCGFRRRGVGFGLAAASAFGGHGFGAHGFLHGKRARMAELERENALLKEENARLQEENARMQSERARAHVPTAPAPAAPAAPGALAASPMKVAAPATESQDGVTRDAPAAKDKDVKLTREEKKQRKAEEGYAEIKVSKRQSKEAESAARETPASLKVGDVVFFQSQTSMKHLRIRKNGAVDGLGNWGACARLRVAGCEGDAIQLTNSKDDGLYLRIGSSGQLETGSTPSASTWFRVVRHEDGLTSLQSTLYPSQIVAVFGNGEAKSIEDAPMNMDAPHGRFRLRLAF